MELYKNHLNNIFSGLDNKRFLIFLAFCFLLLTKVNSQSSDDKTSCWAGSNCTSGDFTITKIYLSDKDGNPLTSSFCSNAGAQVSVYLSVEFTNGTSSDRNGIFLSGNIASNGVSNYIYKCFNGLLPKKTATIFTIQEPFTWTCGKTITLENGFTGWNSASGPVCVSGCSGTTISKCRTYPSQLIQSPLVANFNWSGNCTNGAAFQTISFTNTTTGGKTPYTYKWEYSANGLSWTQFSTDANSTWSPGNSTSYYIRLTTTDASSPANVDVEQKSGISAAACCTTPSITDNPSNATKCAGDNVTFTASATGTPTPTVHWQVKVPNSSFTDISGATSTSLTLNNVNASMSGNQYQAVFTTSSACNTATTTAATLTVNQPSTAPTGISVTGDNPLCSGGSVTLTPTGGTLGTNASYKWYTNSTFTTAAPGTPNATTGALIVSPTTTTTYYVRIEGTATPCTANTGSQNVTINVDQPSVGGTAGSPQTICSGSQPLNDLSVSGITGLVVKWQKSTDNFVSNVSDISSSASSTLSKTTIGNLTQDTWFRAVVQNGVCPTANSSAVKITITSIPDAPTVCIVQPSLCDPAKTQFKIKFLSTGTGYQYSVDGGTNWFTEPVFCNVAAGSNPVMKVKTSTETGGCPSASTLCTNNTKVSNCSDNPACPPSSSISTMLQQKVDDVTLNLQKQTKVTATPNPYNDRIRFNLKSAVSGQGSLELYNMMGQKVKTVYQGYIEKDRIQTIEYNVPNAQRSNLIYLFRVGDQRTSGKLIH